MYRLVVSDIDGTIFGGDEHIPADAPNLVNQLRRHGVFFSLATGRSDSTAYWVVEKLGLSIPFVACNGATIIDPKGKNLVKQSFRIGFARKIVERAIENELSVIYTIDGIEYIPGEAQYILEYPYRFSHPECFRPISEVDWESLMVEKISIMSSHDNASIKELERMCLGCEDQFRYTRYMDRSVELVHPDATKASGVRRLAEMLGISMNDVMFIGDHQNDIELMQACGMGVAVANATDDAKASADVVCNAALFDGVKEAIYKFILGGE